MRFFVYGTLRHGSTHAHLIPGPRVPATTTGRLVGLPGGYPALIDVDEGTVIGECAEVEVGAIPDLDEYEGVGPSPLDYDRVERIVMVNGQAVFAQCYVLSRAGEEEWLTRGGYPIPSGDWLR